MPVRRLKRRAGRPCRGGSLGYGKKMQNAKKFYSWVKTKAMPWLKSNRAISNTAFAALKHGRKSLGSHGKHVQSFADLARTHGFGRRRVVRRKKRTGGSLGYY